jgi:hypothetical protein
MCNVASCWIYEYIVILLGARPILHISRIKVKTCFLQKTEQGIIMQSMRQQWAKCKIYMKFISVEFMDTEYVGEVGKDNNCNCNGEKYRFSVCSGYQCLSSHTKDPKCVICKCVPERFKCFSS